MTASETRKRKAHERAEQIRLDLQGAAVAYAKAIEARDWEVLGYKSVAEWNVAEFGPDRFSPERRKEIHALLTAKGLTVRQIAQATGASKNTVTRDQRKLELVSHNGTPATPRQQAAREREQRKAQDSALVRDLAGQAQTQLRERFRQRVRRAIEAQITGGGEVTGRAVQRRLGLDDDRQVRKVWDELHKEGEVTVRRPQKDEPIVPVPPVLSGTERNWDGPSPWAGRDGRTGAQAQADADGRARQIVEQAVYEGGSRAAIAARAVRRLREAGLLR